MSSMGARQKITTTSILYLEAERGGTSLQILARRQRTNSRELEMTTKEQATFRQNLRGVGVGKCVSIVVAIDDQISA
jgi:hypothetical protein